MIPVPKYQLAERDTSLTAACRVVQRTGSYRAERALAVAALGASFAAALILGLLLAVLLFVYVHKVVASLFFLGLCGWLTFGLVPQIERKLWLMRAAFVYLVTELLVRSKRAPEKDAAALAQRFLTEQFGDLELLFDAHNQMQRLCGSFFRSFDRLNALPPFDLGLLHGTMPWLMERVTPRIADLALSFAIARGDRSFAAASEDALVYVAQNPQALLRTAIFAYLLERVIGGAAFIFTTALCFVAVFLSTNGAAGSTAGGAGIFNDWAQVVEIFAAGLAFLVIGLPAGALVSFAVRTALLEPVGLSMLLIRFHCAIQGQTACPMLRERIFCATKTLSQVPNLANLLD